MNKWTTGLKCDLAPACSYKDKLVEPTVHLPLPVYLVIRQLCEDITIEWQMFLIGSVDGNNYNVTSYYIPKQVVTASSVEDEDNLPVAWYKENNVIGTLHSHGNMGVFFSGTDDTNNQNSPVSCHVVVNNKDEYIACVRQTLPCGMEAFVKCGVSVEVPDKQKITVEGIEKIKKYTYANTWETDSKKGVLEKEHSNYYGPDSVYLGVDKDNKPMWGTQADLDRIEAAGYEEAYGGRGTGYPSIDEINAAADADEKYWKSQQKTSKKSKGKQVLYPWGKL